MAKVHINVKEAYDRGHKKRQDLQRIMDSLNSTHFETQNLPRYAKNRSMGDVKRNARHAMGDNDNLTPGHEWTPSRFGGMDGQGNRNRLMRENRGDPDRKGIRQGESADVKKSGNSEGAAAIRGMLNNVKRLRDSSRRKK